MLKPAPSKAAGFFQVPSPAESPAMLSYQHAYHAGNFADVHKHLAVFSVINHFLRKENAVTYVDTHAGRGLYPLAAEQTSRLKEYRQGVERIWQARGRLDENPLLADWLSHLASAQSGKQLERYPGSPWWLSHRLRDQDRLCLFELHPGEHDHLASQDLPAQALSTWTLSANVRRIHGDGLAGLLGRLPVDSPRLCVLIDPSYELKNEYAQVADCLRQALRKARHGVMLAWYPLLPAGRHQVLLDDLAASGIRKIWRSELRLHEPNESHGMYGSGLVIINPPWGLDKVLNEAFEAVATCLGPHSQHHGGWWVEE